MTTPLYKSVYAYLHVNTVLHLKIVKLKLKLVWHKKQGTVEIELVDICLQNGTDGLQSRHRINRY